MTDVVVRLERNESVEVWFNGLLHAHWFMKDYRGFMSWIDYAQNRFCIAISLRDGGEVLMEYDSFELWRNVVQRIGDVLSRTSKMKSENNYSTSTHHDCQKLPEN